MISENHTHYPLGDWKVKPSKNSLYFENSANPSTDFRKTRQKNPATPLHSVIHYKID